jgi:sigma-B regulation protein RsbU (phosphoserine phosphatase)
LPGRLFLLSTAILITLLVIRQFVPLPEIVDLFRKVVRLAWFVSIAWLGVSAFARNSPRLLWRVRQKLILSYVFLGFVPVLLVVALALAGGLVLYINVAAYMFHEGIADISDDVVQVAETTAAEVGRAPAAAAEVLSRRQANGAGRYPQMSMAMVRLGSRGLVAAAGPWRHVAAPDAVPAWLEDTPGAFRGVLAVAAPQRPTDYSLVLRVVAPTEDHTLAAIVDLPIDPEIVAAIEARTKTRMGAITVPEACGGMPEQATVSSANGMLALFRQTVAFMDCTDWATGRTDRVSVSLEAPLGRIYARVSAPQSAQFGSTVAGGADIFLRVLVALGVFFLIIQAAALFFGGLLARSITYAAHELFVGTERVQQGDFTHRIRIDSGDQLGELAASFNRMSGSIEHLLHVQREKQRLDDELRIARDIQKSLLPTAPPVLAGLNVADLCEPAREVGGDYYDFFDLGPRQLGVMIADVSGKGTSAALYMAELKGLMLSLSGRERSPRRLLIEANRLLSAHLDNRSFITMTYAVIDMEAMTLTCARAGHTPMIVVSQGRSEVVTPSGMVLGLRLPGATERFADVLEEHTRTLCPGDVVVLYTDGITEAMDESNELFSDEALATVVASQHQLDAAGIRERVVREVRAFVGAAEPHDDMTMIVLKVDEAR